MRMLERALLDALRMKMALVVGGLMFSACADSSEEVTVLPLRTPCVGGVDSRLCLRIERGAGDVESLYGGIQGFSPRWGYESRIRMRTGELDTSVEDATEPHFLDEIIAEERVVSAPFDLAFFGLASADDGWFLGAQSPLDMRGTPVECEPALCDALLATNRTSQTFAVTFELTATENVLRAVTVH